MVLGTADARSVFKNNSGDVNVISAIVRGNTLTAMLNGENLLTVQDDAYAEGFSGFFTAPQGDKTLTMDVLSFKEYYRGNKDYLLQQKRLSLYFEITEKAFLFQNNLSATDIPSGYVRPHKQRLPHDWKPQAWKECC